MERKLIKQGKGGFTIYLPKKWVDSKNLKEGEAVDVAEFENGLFVSSESKKHKSCALTLDEEGRNDVKNILTHVYRRGFDKISISGLDNKSFSIIEATIKEQLPGLEVTEHRDDTCVLESLSDPTDQKYEALVRFLFFIIKETQQIIIKDFETNRLSRFKEIEERTRKHDRLVYLCRRILSKELYSHNAVLEWELLTFLMHIQHGHYYLYQYASEEGVKREAEVIALLKELASYFDLFYNAYYKREISSVHKINSSKFKFQLGECIDLLEKTKNPVVVSYIRELFRTIQIGSSPILAGLFDEKITSQA